ncbi:hypothetical protein GCM10022246_24640 [Pedobacter ginsengiterrae]|uniref:Uncharacterized protein n=1 Tax=Pedobacter ginsengiterrae TaxID=871696 RepID=A0ABP7PUE2_9SPHI
METRVNLNYTSYLPESPVSELTFNTPNSATLNQKKGYLYASSPDKLTPIIMTSSDNSVALVKLEESYWYVEYVGTGTVTITASQGTGSVSRTVNISKEELNSGRIFNVGSGSGDVNIDESMNLIAGDTVIIAPGTYNFVNVSNIKIADGALPVNIISNGLVEVSGDFNSYSFRNLRNVIIDGGRTEGIKYGFLVRDNIYQAIYLEDINHITIKNLELKNIYDAGWNWQNIKDIIYDGSEESYQKGNKFINIKADNAGYFNAGGSLDANNEQPIVGLVEGLLFENWDIENSSAGTMINIGCGQNITFNNIHCNHINTINNNHNSVLFCSGTADVINCSVKNFQGNLIRLWTWTLIDGNIKGRITPKKCLFYGNTAISSRKYSFFETQHFDRYIIEGLASFADIDIFNNTGANLNLNIPTVFTGTLLDNYDLGGGTVRCFNNLIINPVNPDSNNIYFSYNSIAEGGSENQKGEIQEFNNRVYYNLEESKINPASLAIEDGAEALRGAIDNTSAKKYTSDYYGNVNRGYIGAIQGKALSIGSVNIPTMPDISEWFDSYDGSSANNFQVNAKRSRSEIGIKNYDIKRNGTIEISVGGNCRDGKADPDSDSGFNVGEVIQWQFRARDFQNQLSDWSERFVHVMPGATYSSVPLTLTKTSGGTLINNDNVYEAAIETVFCSTGISISYNESLRLVFDNVLALDSNFPYVGWAETNQITSIDQIRAGARSGAQNLNDVILVKDGYESKTGYFKEEDRYLSLRIHYDGYTWLQASSDEVDWYKVSSQLDKTSQIIDGVNLNIKFLVIVIPLGCKLSNPRLITYPTIQSGLIS